MTVENINVLRKTVSASHLITTNTSNYVEVTGYDNVSANAVITNVTPAAAVSASATDVDTANDLFTVASSGVHDFTTGLKVQVTTSDTLPTGISGATDYFVIVNDTVSYKLATSLANALANTPVNITGAGVGNQTVTPVSLAGATIKIQYSNDASNSNSWVDGPAANAAYAAALGGSAHSITGDTSVFFRVAGGDCRFIRFVTTSTAGELDYDIYVVGH